MNNLVGPYRVLRLLKRGGQGRVYLGYDDRLSRQVAIKIHSLPPERHRQRRLLERARLVASIQNSRVVQVYDIIASDRHLALIMEYVEGCDLEEALGHHRPSLEVVLAVASQVTGAIAAARQRRVVHGDIKPGNLLLDKRGQLKLADFGVARRSGQFAEGEGTPLYMAPEQYLGERLDVRTDLFALGCLMYRMLAGRQPFSGPRGVDVEALLSTEPEPLPAQWDGRQALPPALCELITQLLQKDPDARPANTHSVRQTLRDLAGTHHKLAAANPLAEFAQPCLRPAASTEPHPEIPPGLGGRRSFLVDASPLHALGRLWRFAATWQRVALGLAALVGLSLLSASAYLIVRSDEPLYLEAPLMQFHSQRAVAVSPAWLTAELEAALSLRLGKKGVRVSEGIRPQPVLYRSDRQPEPFEPKDRLQLLLDCQPLGCLMELHLRSPGTEHRAQALIPAGSAKRHWRSELHSLLNAVLGNGAERRAQWSEAGLAQRGDGGRQQQL